MKGKTSLALKILKIFCPPQLLEEIEGDLLQRFEKDNKSFGSKKANRKLLWNTVRYFRPGIVLRNKPNFSFFKSMILSNYFKVTIRHAAKNKLNFAFKLGGLTIAFFSVMAIATYVSFQFSFDKFHVNYKNIYRVNSIRNENGKDKRSATVPSALGPAMKAALAEVQQYCVLSEWGTSVCKTHNDLYRVSFLEADSTIFKVFTLTIVKGDPSPLSRPGGLVITESLAAQLFSQSNPIGQIISFPDRHDRLLEVRAVIKDLPGNSSIDTKAIMSRGALADNDERNHKSGWDFEYGGNLFVLLNPQVDPTTVASKAQSLVNENMPKPVDGIGRSLSVVLEPLSDIYLSKPWRFQFDRKGNATYVYVFVSLAVFLLIIATVNYLNLSIVDFSIRRKESGVRKVLGARKRQIVFQNAFEALLHCAVASVLSFGLLYLAFDYVTSVFDNSLRFSMFINPKLVILLLGIVLVIVFASSVYPALQQANSNPVSDMKRTQAFNGRFSANQILLFVQFSISVFCISATWVSHDQLKLIQTKDIGLDRNQLLTLFMPDRYPVEKAAVLKNEVNKIAEVESSTFSYYLVTGAIYYNDWYQVEIENQMKSILLNELFVDEDFLQTAKIELLEGRNFNNKNEYKTAFIVNECAAKEFGWTNPIGKKITVGVPSVDGIWSEGNVIGVVKDFNTRSLHKSVEPLVMRLQYDNWPGNCLNIRYRGDEQQAVTKIKTVFQKVLPGFLMDYERVKDRYDMQYKADQKAFDMLEAATWIILSISGIGIFSMSIFLSVKRQREFGIRKVVGATTSQIATLHINQFLKIAGAAIIVALPIAYLTLNWWLNDFVYKTEISGFTMLSSGAMLLVLIVVVTGHAAWRSGRMNPIDVIKIE